MREPSVNHKFILGISLLSLVGLVALGLHPPDKVLLKNHYMLHIAESLVLSSSENSAGDSAFQTYLCGQDEMLAVERDYGASSLEQFARDPVLSCVLVSASRVSCLQGDIQEGLLLLESAKSSCSRSSLLDVLEGDLHYASGNVEGALDDWLRAENGLDAVRVRGDVLRREGRTDEALIVLQEALKRRTDASSDASLGSVYELLGELAFEKKDWPLVVMAFERVVGLKPIRRDAYVFLGQAQREIGDLASSRRTLEDGLQLVSEEDPVLRAALLEQLGATLEVSGEPDQAIEMYREALVLFESQADAVSPARVEAVRQNMERLQR